MCWATCWDRLAGKAKNSPNARCGNRAKVSRKAPTWLPACETRGEWLFLSSANLTQQAFTINMELGILVITSEFDRFDRSDRRLDILALDEDGCLIVIELKLALTGSFADQQAIRYAAFCSTMTMAEVVDAHARYSNCAGDEARGAIAKFLDEDELPELDGQPRIILAGEDLDDQELTSTVLWLRTFGVDISCVEIKPYRLADSEPLLLVSRVIIPLPEARDYIIRVERKQANTAKVVKDREFSPRPRRGCQRERPAAKLAR